MKTTAFLTAALAATTATAHETLSPYHINSVKSKGWGAVGPAPPTSSIRLTVALRQENVEQLTATLHDISNPDSPQYGQFLTQQQVNDLVAPTPATVETVTTWLSQHGALDTTFKATPNKDFLHVDTTVAEAERLIKGTYWTYTHQDTGRTITRLAPDTKYELPDNIAAAVDFVGPTLTFPPPNHNPVVANAASVLAKPDITPPRLRALANMTDADVGNGVNDKNGVKQGVASFLGQEYATSDLLAFRKKYALSTTALDELLVPVPASQKHDNVGVEASMDVQYITSTGNGILTEHWVTKGTQPGNPENEPFVAWLASVATASDPPSVFSISYGDEENGVSYEYAQRCSVEFQKAGARGITLLAASGDGGVGCGTAGFIPTFPASCPYVTGVGAVQGGTPGQSPTGENVADLSGGGFSNYFSRPSYQDDAVQKYKKSGILPEQKQWNATGAGFPDIAGQGILFDVCTENFFYPYSGTSAACPSEAGIVSLLQQDRLTANMTKFGWINPLLYKIGAKGTAAFNDVVDGTNNFCGDDTGFSAAKGWDPVSGWGTINYGNMKTEVMAATTGTVAAVAASKPQQFGRGYSYDTNKKTTLYDASVLKPYQTKGAAPASVDWRTKGAVSPVRDQGQGETCWAFSTAGAIEGAAVAVGGVKTLTPLSPQYLEDCMNIPCANSSGTPDNAFAFVANHENGSMYTWDSYPYVDAGCVFWDPPRVCHHNGTLDVAAKVTSYHHTVVANETDLMMAVAQQPVSVAIYSSDPGFSTYTGGIWYDSGCEDVTANMLDHAVLVVGYGSEKNEDYWIVKNSWAPKWGEDGYIRMRRNVKSATGLCGIAIDASFPNMD